MACQGFCPVDNLARKVACPAGKFYLQYLPWTTGQGFSSPGTSNDVLIFDTLTKSLRLYIVAFVILFYYMAGSASRQDEANPVF